MKIKEAWLLSLASLAAAAFQMPSSFGDVPAPDGDPQVSLSHPPK